MSVAKSVEELETGRKRMAWVDKAMTIYGFVLMLVVMLINFKNPNKWGMIACVIVGLSNGINLGFFLTRKRIRMTLKDREWWVSRSFETLRIAETWKERYEKERDLNSGEEWKRGK